MAAPTTTHSVTARKLSSTISALWTKLKNTFAPKTDNGSTGTTKFYREDGTWAVPPTSAPTNIAVTNNYDLYSVRNSYDDGAMVTVVNKGSESITVRHTSEEQITISIDVGQSCTFTKSDGEWFCDKDCTSWGNYGYFSNGSATAARWGKVASVYWYSDFDGCNTVRGTFEMHSSTSKCVTAQFMIMFSKSAISYAHMYGIFSDSNLTSQVKLQAVLSESNKRLDLYGYITSNSYSGVSVSIMDVKNYRGYPRNISIAHRKNSSSLSNDPGGTTCTNHSW